MTAAVISALEKQHRVLALELRAILVSTLANKDVVGTLRSNETEIKRVQAALDAIEKTIVIFSPGWDSAGNGVRPRETRSPFNGPMRPHLIALLKEADKPMTEGELLSELIRRHVPGPLSGKARNVLQCSMKSQLQRDFAKGLLEQLSEPRRWRLLAKSERRSTMSLAPASRAASAS